MRAQVSNNSATYDFWPAQSLHNWAQAPHQSFLTWLAERRIGPERHFRETSLETYTAIFAAWMHFLEGKGLSILEAGSEEAREFFELKQLEPVSRRRYLQLLAKIYDHLHIIGWLHLNPMAQELKQERALDTMQPENLTDLQVERLVDYLSNQTSWKASRDRALASLLLGAGLRCNEALSLSANDIAMHPDWLIRVRPAGVHRVHHTTVLPDGPWRQWLSEWQGDQEEASASLAVFCPGTRKGGAFSRSGIFRRIDQWLSSCEVSTDQRGANVLRNTFARRALQCKRYSAEDVQEFLGHEELRATLKYAAPSLSLINP